MKPRYNLLTKRRFLPLFLTQFLIGLNDNLMRNALIILITYKLGSSEALGLEPDILVVIASSLLVAPYIIFSSLSGQFADKYERSMLMRRTKIFEFLIMCAAAYGFYTNNVYLLMALLFCAGTQATFFSPMKYSILPDHLHKDEIISGNGFLEGGTFLAILVGSVVGTQLGKHIEIIDPASTLKVGGTLIGLSFVGLISCWYIPLAKPAEPHLHLNINPFISTWNILESIIENKAVLKAVIGTSWFWLIGSVFIAQLPNYTHDVLHSDEDVFTIFLTIFSVGIAIGSLACGILLKGEISTKLARKSLFGVSLSTFCLVLGSLLAEKPVAAEELFTLTDFLSHSTSWLVLFAMLFISFFAGVYAVPLKAIIQTKSLHNERSRVIAGDNIINAFFMVTAALCSAGLLAVGISVLGIFTILAVLNLLVSAIKW